MKQLGLSSALYKFDSCRDFVEEYNIGEDDLIITCSYIYEEFFGEYDLPAKILYQDRYGEGEPSDEMIENMIADSGDSYNRVFGIGGGTVLDIAKLFALSNMLPLAGLFQNKLQINKKCPLILIPTTCGTGSEVTNVAIVGFPKFNTKLRLAADELYADDAVLIPELLKKLPHRVFAASAIDALIHGIESSMSPLATPYSEMFGHKAVEMIVDGFRRIRDNGGNAKQELYEQFLLASNYAGIAFGQAGCGAVHAMSYPLSGKYHVAHGEANYALLIAVLNKYKTKKCNSNYTKTIELLSNALKCTVEDVEEELKSLLCVLLPSKGMGKYGACRDDLEDFADIVEQYQGAIMSHNPVKLSREDIMDIYYESM